LLTRDLIDSHQLFIAVFHDAGLPRDWSA
jgi:hypothetical protein